MKFWDIQEVELDTDDFLKCTSSSNRDTNEPLTDKQKERIKEMFEFYEKKHSRNKINKTK